MDTVEIFNEDVKSRGGYAYTVSEKLGSKLQRARSLQSILEFGSIKGSRVLDAGCGDGKFTYSLYDSGQPSELVALDAASAAVELANKSRRDRKISFVVGDANELPFTADRFDIVILQSILHHLDQPWRATKEAFRVAPVVLIHEPNGMSPLVKIMEKVSPYHRAHDEKSFSTGKLKKWIHEAKANVEAQKYFAFVPMFLPDPVARMMSAVEPIIENTSLLNSLCCGLNIIRARRR